MTTRTHSKSLIPLAMVAGLALLILLTTPFAARPVAAQGAPDAAGDGTVIYGGAAVGGSAAVNTTVGNSADYIISAVVPTAGNFYGAVVELTYDPLKVTPTCVEETVNEAIRVYCNDSYPGNKVRLVIESYALEVGVVVGMKGTNELVTISFEGVAATAPSPSAISSMVVVGNCINGAGQTITCQTQPGNLTVGGGGGPSYPWGDVNCSGSVSPQDAAVIIRIVLSKTPTGVPGGCTQPSDVNCSGSTSPQDAAVIIRMVLSKTPTGVPANCPAVGAIQSSTTQAIQFNSEGYRI